MRRTTLRFDSLREYEQWRRSGKTLKARKCPTEEEEQIRLIEWVQDHKLEYPALRKLYHIPNGGYRKPREAARLRKAGVLPGVPDLHLPVARRGAHALYIELKALEGTPSGWQIERAKEFAEEGNIVAFAWGATQAMEVLLWYLAE